MFGAKKTTKKDLEAEIKNKDEHIEKVEADVVKYMDDLKTERLKVHEHEIALQQEKSNVARLSSELDAHKAGHFFLEGETVHTDRLVYVLREELSCVHDELRALKKAIRASQMLLEPHVSDVVLEK